MYEIAVVYNSFTSAILDFPNFLNLVFPKPTSKTRGDYICIQLEGAQKSPQHCSTNIDSYRSERRRLNFNQR